MCFLHRSMLLEKGGIALNKITSKIVLLVVCAFLSFMLTYKFKMFGSVNNISPNNAETNSKLMSQIDTLNQERKKIEKQNDEITAKLKGYEEVAARIVGVDKDVEELNKARMLLGVTDAQGVGVVFTLTPKAISFTNSKKPADYASDIELTYIINELNNAGAEGICINEKRITTQSGIRTSSGNDYILVNDEKISPKAKITIKAIGNKVKLQEHLKKLDIAKYSALLLYELKIELQDSIVIPKYERKYMDYYLKSDNKVVP